jgi:hypothetical protein
MSPFRAAAFGENPDILLGLEVNDICKELAITPSNYWMMLHHARMSLRLRRRQRRFEKDEAK